ncbi:MAG: DUF222 domain-containing protein [Actinomycetota bacterium]|nr:HNH endonuclease [Actinomycetota bacterium]
MCERVVDLAGALRAIVGRLDVQSLSGEDAMELAQTCDDIVRIASAGRALASRRVDETRAWRSSGSSSAIAWMADQMGSTLRHAATALNTAELLDELPEVREAFVEGRLSEAQAAEISAAAVIDRSAERELVALAGHATLAALRERSRDVIAAATGDENKFERIRRRRYFRSWTDRDGAVRIDGLLAPDDAAPFLAVVKIRTHTLQEDAQRAGERELLEAYAADALVSLVDGNGAPDAVVHVHISSEAFERGHTIAGETCRIDGVGPISVGAARRLAAGSIVKILESDGTDVRRVAHAGRTIPAKIRTALEARDPHCVVPGCSRRYGLEIDHIVPFAEGGLTRLDNLARLCRWHHAQKTFNGWRLTGLPGEWSWSRDSQNGRSPPTNDG